MKIKLNRKIININPDTTVDELVKKTEFYGNPLVVQINAKIVEYNNYNRKLKEGDIVKVFNFVGGG
ncbi:MAG: sulfur carrier protein ThiS [Candidatus Muiribacteriota bacterium]